jgi:hypothetical protein
VIFDPEVAVHSVARIQSETFDNLIAPFSRRSRRRSRARRRSPATRLLAERRAKHRVPPDRDAPALAALHRAVTVMRQMLKMVDARTPTGDASLMRAKQRIDQRAPADALRAKIRARASIIGFYGRRANIRELTAPKSSPSDRTNGHHRENGSA